MKYNPALDGIRALAVLAVVCHHAFVPGFENGRSGVDVFFVLSGYLITSLLAAEEVSGGIRLGAFYLRRAHRLYPALLLMVALVMAVAPIFKDRPTFTDAAIAVTYLTDYTVPFLDKPAFVLHQTWSLAVEEHFYLLWPLVVMGLMRLPNHYRLYLLFAAYIVATWWRWRFIGDFTRSYFTFDTHCTGLILGSMLAFMPRLPSRWWLIAALPLAWWVYGSNQPFEVIITQSEWMGAALVLWGASRPRLLASPPLVFLGRISYGIYLFHYPIMTFCRDASMGWQLTLAASLAGGVGLATLSYCSVERWFRIRHPRARLPEAVTA
jgi:peptidoglycan/LPS O-acetylase OafA/YrhL